MSKNIVFEEMFCGMHEDCTYNNEEMEKQIDSFNELGAIPHCFFAEIAKSTFITPIVDENVDSINLYSCFSTFVSENIDCKRHFDLSFMLFAARIEELGIKAICFGGKCKTRVELSGEELKKLLKVAHDLKANIDEELGLEDVEIEEGNEIIFSSPDPDIPQAFINYLSETISPINEVNSVYVFESILEGEEVSGLVIGVVPSDNTDIDKIDNLAFILINGIEKYMEDREQIDFMILDDDELIEIAQSVSPEILLNR